MSTAGQWHLINYLSMCLYIYLSIYQYIYLFIYLSIYLFILYIYIFFYLSMYLPNYLSIKESVSLDARLVRLRRASQPCRPCRIRANTAGLATWLSDAVIIPLGRLMCLTLEIRIRLSLFYHLVI